MGADTANRAKIRHASYIYETQTKCCDRALEMETTGDDDMETVERETPAIRHSLLYGDVLAGVISALPASMQQITLLKMQRAVCIAFCKAVDMCLREKEWTTPYTTLGMNFCIDFAGTPITPPISLVRGITRMLFDGEIAELVVGMKEFVADRATMNIVFGEIRKYVSVHDDGNTTVGDLPTGQLNVRLAEQAGMPAVVAWGMRCHSDCTSIQQNGSRILGYFSYPQTQADSTDANCLLQVYFIGALADAMHDNLADCKLQQSCLDAMRAITVGMLEEGALLQNELVQPGRYNVLNLIIDAMMTHMQDERLVLAAVYMASVYGHIIYDQGFSEHKSDIDVKKAESVVLAGMKRYYVQAPDIAKLCIMVQLHLVGSCMSEMKSIYDIMQCSLNAVQIHTHDTDLVNHMQKLYREIMRQMQCCREPQQQQHMQDYAANRGAIQLSLSSFAHFLNIAVSSGSGDVDSEETFYMLMALCEGNARVKSLIVDAQAVRILEGMRKVLNPSSYEETVFTRNLHDLKQMLFADNGASQNLSADV